MKKIFISKCKNGHYFFGKSYCPFCKEPEKEQVEYHEGDCIDCGMLCSGYAYACTQPNPINLEKDKKQSN